MRFKVDSLSAGYAPGSRTVRGLSIEITAGETLCLLGRNGAGKTTALKAIMGLVPSREGTVTVDGEPISGRPAHRIPSAGIGYVPQGRRLFAELTVRENLEVGAYVRRHRRVDYEAVFDLFPRLKERLSQVSGTLSGGEQQMLAMARALCLDPRVLLLDEPTEGLMPAMVSAIGESIRRLASGVVSVLMVEQRLDVVRSTAQRVCLMDNGTIRKTLPVGGLSADMETVRRYLSV